MAAGEKLSKDALTEFKLWFQIAFGMKQMLMPEWNMNMSFYMGNQWIKSNLINGNIIRLNNTKGQQYTYNVIRPAVNSIMAKITAPNPVIHGEPKSGNSSDINAARIAEYVCESEIWDNFNMPVQMQRIIPIMATCGSIVAMPYFNPAAGNKVMSTDPNDVDEEGNPKPALHPDTAKEYYEGRLECDWLTPFEVTPDGGAVDEDSLERVAITKMRSQNWIYENYGIEVAPTKSVHIQMMYDKFTSTLLGTTDGGRRLGQTMVHTEFRKKCKDYPKGLTRIMTEDGEVLDEMEKLPWGLDVFNVIPLVKADYEAMQNSFWGKAPISIVRSPQRTINKIWSMYMSHIALYSFPNTLNPIGNGVKKNMVDTSRPGNWVDYVPMGEGGGKPEYMNSPQFNPQILDGMNMAKMYIDDVFGLHQVSRATAPAGVKTGRALSILDSADDTKIHPVVIQIENMLSKLSSVGLQIIESEYTQPRMIKMVGKPNARLIRDFQGDKLNGNTNVRMKIRSALPMNKSAAIDTAMAFWTNQVIPHDENGLKVMHEMIEMEAYKPMLESTRDEEQAEWENAVLDTGAQALGQVYDPKDPQTANIKGPDGQTPKQPGPIGMPNNDWDNDEIHLKVHEGAQKEISYLEEIQTNPAIHQAYSLHKAWHQQRLIQKNQMQMQQQMQTQQQQTQEQAQMQIAMKKQMEQIEAQTEITVKAAIAKIDEQKEIAIAEAEAHINAAYEAANPGGKNEPYKRYNPIHAGDQNVS